MKTTTAINKKERNYLMKIKNKLGLKNMEVFFERLVAFMKRTPGMEEELR